MHYFVDGYNLIFRRIRAGENLQEQRAAIIYELDEAADLLELDITIVFDAQYHLGIGSRGHYHHIEICFTDEGETADDYILEAVRLQKKPHQETVVTSDKKLAMQARRRLAKTETVEQFMAKIGKRCQNKQRRQTIQKPAIPAPVPEPKIVVRKAPEFETDLERWERIFEERFQALKKDKGKGSKGP